VKDTKHDRASEFAVIIHPPSPFPSAFSIRPAGGKQDNRMEDNDKDKKGKKAIRDHASPEQTRAPDRRANKDKVQDASPEQTRTPDERARKDKVDDASPEQTRAPEAWARKDKVQDTSPQQTRAPDGRTKKNLYPGIETLQPDTGKIFRPIDWNSSDPFGILKIYRSTGHAILPEWAIGQGDWLREFQSRRLNSENPKYPDGLAGVVSFRSRDFLGGYC
jgi:hypothetical protein